MFKVEDVVSIGDPQDLCVCVYTICSYTLFPTELSPRVWQVQHLTEHWSSALPHDQRTTASYSEPLPISCFNTTSQLHHTRLGNLSFTPETHLLQHISADTCDLRSRRWNWPRFHHTRLPIPCPKITSVGADRSVSVLLTASAA